MNRTNREPAALPGATPQWIAGVAIGLTVSGFAAAAMALGAGFAIGMAIAHPEEATDGTDRLRKRSASVS